MSKHSSGKNESKKKAFSEAKKLKPTIFLLGFLLVAVGIFGVLYNPSNSAQEITSWDVSESGTLSFSQRGKPEFTVQEIEDVYAPENPDTLKLLSFESNGDKVQALLRLPVNSNSSSGSPGIVLLPGATVSKEGEQGLAVELSKMGYATLTLDQRNLGGINAVKDLELFKADLEPVQYLMVYDALKAADVLAAQQEIDPEKLAIIGESNGGRFAILVCALDSSLKGVIGISTSGYGTGEASPANFADFETYRFSRSIDPDTYLSSLPPAKLVLIHSLNDTLIPYNMSLRTFDLAKNPKVMYNVTEATHGYTGSMRPYLEKELALLLN